MTTEPTVATSGEYDLSPDPRILRMLGEINLDPWRCLAELTDNGIDSFLQADRAGEPVESPEIQISIPNRNDSSARVHVVDNGPGMDAASLELAVRAGYSGNNPTDNLGLFGMGFNIATARLGATTTVWTTRAGDTEYHGVRIDFDELSRQRSFRTPHLVQSKSNPAAHGTRIEISNLKPEQRADLCKAANQRSIKNMLARSYASMLRPLGDPIHFRLKVNDVELPARQHSVWAEERRAHVAGVGDVSPYRPFNHRLTDYLVCSNCMTSMFETELINGACISCARSDTLLRRERHIRGWIGLQRYLSTTEFGFDFIRNGRKIEIANKDLFVWSKDGVDEAEYPIDDQRNRGRFVGEIHIDHCPVDYSKTRFERTSYAWQEMVRYIRGEGPLRPNIAQEQGYGPNDSLLFTLFRAFRRTSPASSQAGGWSRVLVVPNNDRAVEMAQRFYAGEADYQTDEKWWEIIQEEDEKRLYGRGAKGGRGGEETGEEGDKATGGDGPDIVDELLGGGGAAEQPPPQAASAPSRERIPSLSREYEHPKPFQVTFQVEAYRVAAGDADLPGGSPWRLMLAEPKSRVFNFIYDERHPIFASITMSPLDALQSEVAWLVHEGTRSAPGQAEIPFAAALAELRNRYAVTESVDYSIIAAQAAETLRDLADAIVGISTEDERKGLFQELTEEERAIVTASITARGGSHTSLDTGGFLRFFPDLLIPFVDRRPSLFFDGAVWDIPHDAIDLREPNATAASQRAVRERTKSRIADALWASALDRLETPPDRDEVIRAVTALRLLEPDHMEP